MLNRFTGDNQLTVLGSMNNTNNAGFSDIAQDLSQASFMYSLSGGRRGPGGGGGRMPGQIDGIQTSKVLGGNLSHTFNPSLILGGNLTSREHHQGQDDRLYDPKHPLLILHHADGQDLGAQR